MLYLCICVFVFVYLCVRHLVISVLISLDQELSENIWFVWYKTSYGGDKWRCNGYGTNDEQGKIGLLSQWTAGGWVSQFLDIDKILTKLEHLQLKFILEKTNIATKPSKLLTQLKHKKLCQSSPKQLKLQPWSSFLWWGRLCYPFCPHTKYVSGRILDCDLPAQNQVKTILRRNCTWIFSDCKSSSTSETTDVPPNSFILWCSIKVKGAQSRDK